MPDEIEPAMTPDEWKNPSLALGGYADLFIYGKRASPRELHALAALALHGQPFGFTRKELLWLYGLANILRTFRMEIDADECEAFAAKLAALLPAA